MKSDNLQPKFIQVLEITNLNIFYSVFFMLRTLMQWVPLLTFILKLFTWENGQKTQFEFDVVPYLLPCLQF